MTDPTLVVWPYKFQGYQIVFDTAFVSAVRPYYFSKWKWVVDVWVVGLDFPLRRIIRCENKGVRPDAAINEVITLIGWEVPS